MADDNEPNILDDDALNKYIQDALEQFRQPSTMATRKLAAEAFGEDSAGTSTTQKPTGKETAEAAKETTTAETKEPDSSSSESVLADTNPSGQTSSGTSSNWSQTTANGDGTNLAESEITTGHNTGSHLIDPALSGTTTTGNLVTQPATGSNLNDLGITGTTTTGSNLTNHGIPDTTTNGYSVTQPATGSNLNDLGITGTTTTGSNLTNHGIPDTTTNGYSVTQPATGSNLNDLGITGTTTTGYAVTQPATGTTFERSLTSPVHQPVSSGHTFLSIENSGASTYVMEDGVQGQSNIAGSYSTGTLGTGYANQESTFQFEPLGNVQSVLTTQQNDEVDWSQQLFGSSTDRGENDFAEAIQERTRKSPSDTNRATNFTRREPLREKRKSPFKAIAGASLLVVAAFWLVTASNSPLASYFNNDSSPIMQGPVAVESSFPTAETNPAPPIQNGMALTDPITGESASHDALASKAIQYAYLYLNSGGGIDETQRLAALQTLIAPAAKQHTGWSGTKIHVGQGIHVAEITVQPTEIMVHTLALVQVDTSLRWINLHIAMTVVNGQPFVARPPALFPSNLQAPTDFSGVSSLGLQQVSVETNPKIYTMLESFFTAFGKSKEITDPALVAQPIAGLNQTVTFSNLAEVHQTAGTNNFLATVTWQSPGSSDTTTQQYLVNLAQTAEGGFIIESIR